MTGREGWWATHEFHKRSVLEAVPTFCGWNTLLNLIAKCKSDEERGLIATLFETGGRASEVLTLRRHQFEDEGSHILVVGMQVLKQKIKKLRQRNVPIEKDDPLTPHMMQWVEQRKDNIFRYKYDWLYKRVRAINPDWFPHRFRAERASQLAKEKEFRIVELKQFFGWKTEDMPAPYTRMDVSDLVKLMLKNKL